MQQRAAAPALLPSIQLLSLTAAEVEDVKIRSITCSAQAFYTKIIHKWMIPNAWTPMRSILEQGISIQLLWSAHVVACRCCHAAAHGYVLHKLWFGFGLSPPTKKWRA
ncbi:hypothetical protein DAI22_02g014501 [Oryza sativa Japonica Group]|nr:hypothetical protein DAI22_02g014501 [Oryza sativa Japonica Group]